MRNVAIGVALLVVGLGAAEVHAQSAATPFRADVERLTKRNTSFRQVLFTGQHIQIVAMSLAPNEDIGAEVHDVDQCFFVVDGEGRTTVGEKTGTVRANDVLCVPAGVRHNVRSAGGAPLKLYTLYSPPQHPAGTVHRTKQEAEQAEAKSAR